MAAPLNEIIGLPRATPATELARAAERCCETLFARASCGDTNAQREIVELRVASLIWAYAKREADQRSELH
ncbi:MAG: hypothetical protein Q8M11_21365 [Sulfuritalea sp.]|nr:hypothetical protein [Sulfuritalea sp.]MDP1983590.1 hypothetical protein [Sulfuritalea sp.]